MKSRAKDSVARLLSVLALVVSMASAIFSYQANQLAKEANQFANEANRIALRAATSDVAFFHVDSSWINHAICKHADGNFSFVHWVSIDVGVSNNGGQSVSLVNAEALYAERWYQATLARVEDWQLSSDSTLWGKAMGSMEALEKDKGVVLPFDIPPGTSRKLSFTASWPDSALYSDLDTARRVDLLMSQRGYTTLPQAVIWRFYFGNGQVLSYQVKPPTPSEIPTQIVPQTSPTKVENCK